VQRMSSQRQSQRQSTLKFGEQAQLQR
jgi:hypothetical protein